MNKLVLLFCVASLAFAYDVQLVNQDGEVNDQEGNVQVNPNGYWQQICGDGFNLDDAKVVCRSLGHDSADVVSGEHGIPRNLSIAFTQIDCNGDESSIEDCSKRVFKKTDRCSTSLAAVDCTSTQKTTGTLGLEGGIIAAIIICLMTIIGMILLFGACLWRNEICCAASAA